MAWEDFATVFVTLFPFTLFAFHLPFSLLHDIDTGTQGTRKWGTQGSDHKPGQDAAQSQGSAAGKQDWFWYPGLMHHHVLLGSR